MNYGLCALNVNSGRNGVFELSLNLLFEKGDKYHWGKAEKPLLSIVQFVTFLS